MKKIIYLAIISIISISCKAQSNVIEITDWCNHQTSETNGTLYLKDINNSYIPFVGTWKWISGNKELILTLTKQTKHHYNQGVDNYYEDRIVGYYIYKEDGIILVNTSNDDLNRDYGVNINLVLDCYSQLTTIRFQDILKNKSYDGWIELLSATSIKFHFKEDTHIRMEKPGYPMPPVYVGNTFPLDMVLIKQ